MALHGHHKKQGRGKVEKVMHEFKEGSLHSSSGQKVRSRKQAVAIAMSEAGRSKQKRHRRKSLKEILR